MKDFRNLQVWQKAHALTLKLYKITKDFPADERFGLTSQLRRAASSMGANLAEGCARGTDGELQQFTQIAKGSASEVEYHLLLAHDLELLATDTHSEFQIAIVEVKRMLASLLKKLKADR